MRWQDFFVRRFLVLVCQPNALCKLNLKILHLLHFVVSEMNFFCFSLVLILSHAQLTLAVTLEDKIHLPSNTKSVTKNQDPLVSVYSSICLEENKTTKVFKGALENAGSTRCSQCSRR